MIVRRPSWIQVLAISAGLVAAGLAFAGNAGWTGYRAVAETVVIYDGGINVRLSPDITGCIARSGYGGNFASIPADHPGIQRMKANLIAAQLSGKKVNLYFHDNICTVQEMRFGAE